MYDTVTVDIPGLGRTTTRCPEGSVARRVFKIDDNNVMVVFALKLKTEDSTYAAVARAKKEYPENGSPWEPTPWIDAACTPAGAPFPYGVRVYHRPVNEKSGIVGMWREDKGRCSSNCQGTSNITPSKLIVDVLNTSASASKRK
jgi:hypothetical protein